MTRGKFVLVNGGKVYVSCEFNGDMYYEHGHGPEVVGRLQRVTDYDSLLKEVTEFDKENFGYAKDNDDYFGISDYTLEECGNKIDCKQSTYFDDWFSDYLYVKNENGNTITILDYDGEEHNLNPGEIMVLDFGKPEKLVDSDGTVISYDEQPEEDEEETEEEEEDEDDLPFEDETVSITVSSKELEALYVHGFIQSQPTQQEIRDAIHAVIKNL